MWLVLAMTVAVAGGSPDGSPCLTSSSCSSGVCEGMGCTDNVPGRCVSAGRHCTADIFAYCGCDDVNWMGSSTCASVRYKYPYMCGEPEPWKKLNCGSQDHIDDSLRRGALPFQTIRCLETAVRFSRKRDVQDEAHSVLARHAVMLVQRARAAAAGETQRPPHPPSLDQARADAERVVQRWVTFRAANKLDPEQPRAACLELNLPCAFERQQ